MNDKILKAKLNHSKKSYFVETVKNADKITEQLKTSMKTLADSIEKKDSENLQKAIEQQGKVIEAVDKLTTAINSGVNVNNLEEIEQQKEVIVSNLNDLDITTEKVEIPDWIASKDGLKEVVVSVDKAVAELKALNDVKPSQKVTDFVPFRRVRFDGFKLVYDDSYWGGSSGGGGGSSAATETVTYENRNDTTTDTNLVYLGKALPGTATSDASWQIKRYNKSAGHMSFADDVTTFTKQWSERTTYGY
jgi:hypothetical protein